MGLIIERPQPCAKGYQVMLNVRLTTLEEDLVQTELPETCEIHIKSANTGVEYVLQKPITVNLVARNAREGYLLFSFPQEIGVFNTYYIIEVIRSKTGSSGTTSIVYTSAPGLINSTLALDKRLITFTYTPGNDTTARLAKYKIDIYKNEQFWETSGLQIANSNMVEYNFEKAWIQEEEETKYKVNIITWSNRGLNWEFSSVLSKTFAAMKKIEGTENYASTLLLNVRPQVQIDEEYGHATVTMPLTMRIYGSEIYYSDNHLQLMVDKNVGYGIDRRLLQYSNLNKLIQVYGDLFGNSLLSIGANVFDITNKYLFLIPFPEGRKMPTNFCIDVPYSAHFYLYRQQDNGLYYKVYDESGKAVEPIVCHEVDNNGNVTNLFRYEDYAVEHGSEYNYAISQYKVNSDTETVPVGLAETHAIGLLDNIILSDATRELKIKFNPKISSFKTIIQEQKIDTIGGKYPFFFRNGDVNYKEMSLEGLISYTADDQMHFMQDDSFLRVEDEFYRERIYKREVEDWLNNGQPKLLRTAAEGSFLVRLMNVSLTPIDTLGRRLHSFSATAYEVGSVSDSVLKQYGLNGKLMPVEFDPEAYAPYPGDSTSDYRWIKVGKLPKGLRSSDKDVLINFKEYQKILPIDRILFKNVRKNAGIAYNGKKLLYGDKTSEEQILISGYEGYYCKWFGEASANMFEITNDTVDDYNIEVYIGYPSPKRIALEEVE